MNRSVRNIAKQIEELAENSKLYENEIIKQLNTYFELKEYNEAVKAYKKRQKHVLVICKELNISTKRFYKILKAKRIKLNTRS